MMGLFGECNRVVFNKKLIFSNGLITFWGHWKRSYIWKTKRPFCET